MRTINSKYEQVEVQTEDINNFYTMFLLSAADDDKGVNVNFILRGYMNICEKVIRGYS